MILNSLGQAINALARATASKGNGLLWLFGEVAYISPLVLGRNPWRR